MPRYVWDTFNTITKEIETTKWTEELSSYTAPVTTLPFSYTKEDPDSSGKQFIRVSSKFIDNPDAVEYIETDANIYFELSENTESLPTFRTHPYVSHIFTEEIEPGQGRVEFKEMYWVQNAVKIDPPNTDPTTEEPVAEPSINVSYFFRQKTTDISYEKGDQSKGIKTSNTSSTYPSNGNVNDKEDPDNVEKMLWYVFSGADNVDPTDVTYNETEIGLDGTFVTATLTKSSGITYDATLKYDWEYTTDNGNQWNSQAENVSNEKYVFDVPGSTTGFAVRVRVSDDGYGYSGDWVTGDTLHVSSNLPPNEPTITLPEKIYADTSYLVKWSASIDPEGTPVQYVLESKTDSTQYEQVYFGNSTQFTDIQYKGTTSVQYRIRAVDSDGLYSEYAYSSELEVSTNHPPLISGENKNLGLITEFNESYIITDTDSDTLSAIEYLDDKKTKTIDSVTPGQTYQIQITGGEWNKLSDSTHIVKVVATDVNGASSQRSWVFRKNSGSSEDVDQEFYRVYQKQKDGSYKLFRFENVTENVYHHDFRLDSVLDRTLPEVRPTNDLPEDISEGKIIIGNDKVWVGGANGTVIELTKQKGGHVAQKTPPSDTSLLWVDTSDPASPLLRFYSGSKWDYIKSVYSGGTKG